MDETKANKNAVKAAKFATSLSETMMDVLKASKRPWRYVRIARELTARGLTTMRGGVIRGETVRRLMDQLPDVVAAANEYRSKKENEDFRRFLGKEPPSRSEVLEALEKWK